MSRALPLAVGLLAALALMLTTPSVWLAPTERTVGLGQGDLVSIAWSLDHVAWSLFHGQSPVGHTDRLIFPAGGALAPTALGPAMLLAPLTWLLGGVFAYNLLVLLDVGLTAGLGVWAARRWDADVPGALAVGLGLAGGPVMAATLFNENPDVAALYGLPLVVGLARGSRPLVVGLVAGLTAWASPYVGVMATLAGLACLPWRTWPAYLGGVALTGLPFLLWVQSTLGVGTVVGAKEGTPRSTSLMNLVLPGVPLMPVKGSDSVVAQSGYLGLSVVAVGLGVVLRQRRWALGALAGAGLLLALGPALVLAPGQPGVVPLPGALWAHAPGLGQLRLTGRFTALVGFALTMAWATSPGRWRWRWGVMALLLLDLVVLPDGWSRLEAGQVLAPADRALLVDVDGPVLYLGETRRDEGLRVALVTREPISEGIKMGMPPFVHAALRRDDLVGWAMKQGYTWVVAEPGSPLEACLARGERLGVARLSTCAEPR